MTDRFSGRLAHCLVNIAAVAGSEERKKTTTNAGTTKPAKKEKEQQMKTQISKRIMKHLAMLVVPCLMVGALTVAARADDRARKDKGGQYEQGKHHGHGGHADKRAAKIQGRGTADMVASADTFVPVNGVPTADLAYPINTQFKNNHFRIKAKVHADGSATGTARFVFGDEFSNAWGADAITLECEIDTGSVSEDGTVVLQGLSFEEDFVDGVVTFEELSPFEIIIDPSGSFSLRWCAIPALDLEITKGHLKVK